MLMRMALMIMLNEKKYKKNNNNIMLFSFLQTRMNCFFRST